MHRSPSLLAYGEQTRSQWVEQLQNSWGRLLYSYFNWRQVTSLLCALIQAAYGAQCLLQQSAVQDTWNDLQLFMLLNVVLLGLGALMRNIVADVFEQGSGEGTVGGAWQNVYEVSNQPSRCQQQHAQGPPMSAMFLISTPS